MVLRHSRDKKQHFLPIDHLIKCLSRGLVISLLQPQGGLRIVKKGHGSNLNKGVI